MKLFLQYLKQRKGYIFALGLFSLIFLISFSLYRLPVKAVLYPVCLCFILGVLFLIADFRRVRKKSMLLGRIHGISDMILDALPESGSIEEGEYQRILRLITEEHHLYQTAAMRQYEDMVDYYTVWVHQIKTPIASMRLRLQNEDSVFSRKLSGDLRRVEQYVEMVLAFLRLNSDSTDYVIKEQDLDGIIRQAVKKFSGEFIGRKLSLHYEPVNIKVVTDEKWLSFVLEQILSNALKYTPSGSIAIFLEPEKKLCIQDTGIGIAKSDLPRIFENGFTGYNGRIDKKASGIGLYLCKHICDNLGHGIYAESEVDKGTRIILDLEQAGVEVE